MLLIAWVTQGFDEQAAWLLRKWAFFGVLDSTESRTTKSRTDLVSVQLRTAIFCVGSAKPEEGRCNGESWEGRRFSLDFRDTEELRVSHYVGSCDIDPWIEFEFS